MNSSGDSQSGSVFGAGNLSLGYVSCIEIDGRPILPPLMTESRRAEMRRYRELAIRIETNRIHNKRQRKNLQLQPTPEPEPELDQTDQGSLHPPTPVSLPLNTTVTFGLQTSPLATSTSPPVSLSSTFTKIPSEARSQSGTRNEVKGGSLVLPGTSAATFIPSNLQQQPTQGQISKRIPVSVPAPLPVQLRAETQQPKSNTAYSNYSSDLGQDKIQGKNQGPGYDGHFVIKKGQELHQQQLQTQLYQSNQEAQEKEESNGSSSPSTSETQIHQLNLPPTSLATTFTKYENDDDLDTYNIEEDSHSESMSMVSLDTEEEQIRQEIVMGQDQHKVDQNELQGDNDNYHNPQDPNPFVTTRPLTLTEPVDDSTCLGSGSGSDSSLENYFAQASTAQPSNSTASGRSSTETFIIERHGNVATSDEIDTESGTGTDSDNVKGVSMDSDGGLSEESKSEGKAAKRQRKYYFSPLETQDRVSDPSDSSSTTFFDASFDQNHDGAPSTVKAKKSYFDSPSLGVTTSSASAPPTSFSSHVPVPVPFQGYAGTEVEAKTETKVENHKTTTRVTLTEVSFVTSLGSTSSNSPSVTSKELTLSHSETKCETPVSRSHLKFDQESPTKLSSTTGSPAPSPRTATKSQTSQTQRSGIPQFYNNQNQNFSPGASALSARSPVSSSIANAAGTGNKRYYFDNPEADTGVDHSPKTKTNNTVKDSIYNYSGDRSTSITSSFSVGSPSTPPGGYQKYYYPPSAPNTTPTKPTTATTVTKIPSSPSKIPLSPSKLNTVHNVYSTPTVQSPSSQPQLQHYHQSLYALDGNGNVSMGKSGNNFKFPAAMKMDGAPRTLRTPTKPRPVSESENKELFEEGVQEAPLSPGPPVRKYSPPIKSFSMPYDGHYSDSHYGNHEGQFVSPQMSPHHQNNQPPSHSSAINTLGRVNLATLQTTMQHMSPSFFKVPPDARSPLLKGVVLMDPLFRPKRELRIPPQALDPKMQPIFARVTAAARGYLVRRLLRTEKIQMIIQTIRDTVELVLKLYEEVPQLRVRGGMGMNNVRHEDAELCRRLFQQLTGACSSFHDVFFKLTPIQRMAIIAQDREKIRAKELKNYFSRSRSYRGGGGGSASSNSSHSTKSQNQRNQHQLQQHSRSVSSSSKRKISTATVKCLERRMSALHS